jgi:IS5 family transposase
LSTRPARQRTSSARCVRIRSTAALDYQVEVGNPPDAPLLVPAVGRISRRAGRVPAAVTADRQYGEAAVDQQLAALGVERVAIPRKGQPGAARRATEHARGFRRLVKWRTGCEGRISHLKHRYGWDRTRMDGIGGARIWCGHGVLAHNLVKISGLIEAKQAG